MQAIRAMIPAGRAIARSAAPRVQTLKGLPHQASVFSTSAVSDTSTPPSLELQMSGEMVDDHHHEPQMIREDPSRRAFTYMVTSTPRFVYAAAGRLAVLKFISTMSASADVLALSSVECDISKIAPGELQVVKWRGKPVFVKHRTAEEIADCEAVDPTSLRDPEADSVRYQKPEWLICLGVCTHLGCVPLGNAGDYKGGWFCPCHGSHYDACGRIRKGPAPLNLEVPQYEFMDDDTVKLG